MKLFPASSPSSNFNFSNSNEVPKPPRLPSNCAKVQDLLLKSRLRTESFHVYTVLPINPCELGTLFN